MGGVNTFDWRRRPAGSHTREVKSEHLPEGVLVAMRALADKVKHLEELTTEMAQQIANQNLRTIGTVERLSNLEAAIGALAAEAEKRLGVAA